MSVERLKGFERRNKAYVDQYAPDLVEIYALIPDHEAPLGEGAVNRIGGRPIGVDRRGWPRYARLRRLLEQDYRAQDKPFDGDTRMEHVFTLDLRQTPELRRRPGVPPDAVAMAFFLSSRGYNTASHAGSGQTATIFLTEAHLAAGLYEGPMPARSQDDPGCPFEVVALQVPVDIFRMPHHEDEDQRQALYELRMTMASLPAYAGLEEVWIQGDDDFDDDDDLDRVEEDEDGVEDDADDEVEGWDETSGQQRAAGQRSSLS